MELTKNEKIFADVMLYVLDTFKSSTLTVEYHSENPEVGGVKFDREATECIKFILAKALEEQKAGQ